MNKSLNTSIFKTSLMAMLLTSAFSAQAAGLGKLSVYSGIGQQLSAEVALSATPAELNSMTAKLASPEAFREAGIEYMSALSDVRFSLDKSSTGQPVLRMTTIRPITEPFLHFLVELSWTSGRMVREYTFLLDPPEMLQVAKPASIVAPVAPATKPLPSAATQPVVPSKPVAPAAKPTASATGEYQVKQGDTLGKIARETRPESVTLDQMLVALFNGNQEAFAGNNMNRLRAGKILRVPTVEEAGKVDPAEARKLVIGQTSEFNAYRSRLAGAATEAPVPEAAPQQQVSGTIKPRVEDKAPAPSAKDKLEVSRTEPAKTAKMAAGGSLEEDLIARDKALREASERIVQLEKNIENLKQLVEIKSQTGAKLQQESQASLAKPDDKTTMPVKPEAVTTPPVPVAATESAAKPEEAAKPAVPAEPVAAKPVEPAPVAPPPQPVAKKPVVPLPPPPEPSFIDENPEIVFGGGGLVALLLGYLGYSSWRRKKAQAAEPGNEASASSFSVQEAAPLGVVPAAGMDTGEISIQGDFSESSLLTNEEIVDPVAEADVLMAYGRDRQAEEILQEGLNKDPARPAIHMKLLELYAKQENIAQFEAIARKLHALNNGRGADWDKTLATAHTLGLSGGIFAGATMAAEALKPAVAVDVLEPSVTVEPQAVAEVAGAPSLTEAVETPAEEEVPSLEFDLDLGTTSGNDMETTAAVAETAVATPPAEEDMSLDFDFDLGTPEVQKAVEAVVEKAEAAEKLDLTEMDFDLDLGSPVETASGQPEIRLEDADVSLAAAQAENALQETPVTGGIGDLKLDFDLELDQGAVEATVPDIAVERAPATAAVTGAGELAASATPPSKPDNPEVATKLELAQAYEEMGDLEGARELLNEVVNEGSVSQQAQARAKLDQLSG